MDFAAIAGDAMFRANPSYRLVQLDQLDSSDLRSALEHGLDATAYGVFLPADGSMLRVRSACAESALLVLSLQSPARIPGYLRKQDRTGWVGEVKKLVLDEILQVQMGDGYLSGSAIMADGVPLGRDAKREDEGLLAFLSNLALLYAERLDIFDPTILSGRLYCFNRRPFCIQSHSGLVDRNQITSFLRLPELETELSLGRYWGERSQSQEFSGWLNFVPKTAPKRTKSDRQWTCKLYISAVWSHLPEALFRFLSTAASRKCATGFKVPCDVFGLLRPDNFVVYLKSKDALHELADELAPALRDIPVQGVPFSSPLTQDGLLSWGADPPKGSDYSLIAESWRLWLTNQLASNLVRAKAGGETASPRALALERLRLEGVDVDSWTPPVDVV